VTNHLWFEQKVPTWYAPDGGCYGHEANELHAVAAFAESIHGWLSDAQGLALYQMARLSVKGSVVEIGSFCGKSTLFIALGCRHSDAAFYAVDPHRPVSKGGKEQFGPDFQPYTGDSLGELRKSLERCDLAAYVTLLIATSEEARHQLPDLPLKLLFIDGNHEYPDVLLDYELWHEMIVTGGVLSSMTPTLKV
jgi:MMP 1-O-methyltransferase